MTDEHRERPQDETEKGRRGHPRPRGRRWRRRDHGREEGRRDPAGVLNGESPGRVAAGSISALGNARGQFPLPRLEFSRPARGAAHLGIHHHSDPARRRRGGYDDCGFGCRWGRRSRSPPCGRGVSSGCFQQRHPWLTKADDAASRQRRPPDPDLEPGFPVRTYETAGLTTAGRRSTPSSATSTATDDGDSGDRTRRRPPLRVELGRSPQPGWPVAGFRRGLLRTGSALHCSPRPRGLLRALSGDDLVAYDGAGVTLPGWPRNSANYVATPPSLAMWTATASTRSSSKRRTGGCMRTGRTARSSPAGPSASGQERHTPAVGDLDGDSVPGNRHGVRRDQSPGVYLFAYHPDGTPVAGFPVLGTGSSTRSRS